MFAEYDGQPYVITWHGRIGAGAFRGHVKARLQPLWGLKEDAIWVWKGEYEVVEAPYL